jgi:serine phosphatase RsbU (regulator of sigma subunit)
VVIRRADGHTSLAGARHSAPLGVFPDWSCGLEEAELSPGDVLVLYTDGVIEARRGKELFGEGRLLDWVQHERDVQLAELPSALLDGILDFTGGSLEDDLAIMAVEITTTG